MENKQPDRKQAELRRGVTVFIMLAVLTAIEYYVGTQELPGILLWIIALAKFGLVVWYFMHVKRAFTDKGEHE